MFRCGRMCERRRPERTPLRREHHALREHSRIVLVQVQLRVCASQQVRMRGRGRVQRRGNPVSHTRHLRQLTGQLQLQVRGRIRRGRVHLQT